MDTTMRVDARARDRFAMIAAERGMTLREYMNELAGATYTRAELEERGNRTAAYIREHFCPDLTEEELREGGDQIWRDLASGARTTL